MTLTELIEAYKRGEADLSPLMIDNDHVSVVRHNEDWTKTENVFAMHPVDLMEQLLDHVGIPHEGV